MEFQPIPGRIPADVKAQLSQHIKAAVGLLQPYFLDLSPEHRERLGSGGLGPESLPFAQTAGRLMEKHPDVLPRSVKDEEITQYLDRLAIVTDCQDLLAEARPIMTILRNLDIAAGAGLMKLARDAYHHAQRDNGRTAGVEELVAEMKQRYARKANNDDDQAAAPANPSPDPKA